MLCRRRRKRNKIIYNPSRQYNEGKLREKKIAIALWLTIMLVTAAVLAYLCYDWENSSISSKADLEYVTGELTDYKYYESVKSRSSTRYFRIWIEEKSYTISESLLLRYQFDKEYFARTVEIGDKVTLLIDPLRNWGEDFQVAEVWCEENGNCYLTYEQYAEDFYNDQKFFANFKWFPPTLAVFSVVIARLMWKKNLGLKL